GRGAQQELVHRGGAQRVRLQAQDVDLPPGERRAQGGQRSRPVLHRGPHPPQGTLGARAAGIRFRRFRWCVTVTPCPPTPQQHPERAGGGGRAPGGAALGGGGRHIGHVSAHATTVVAACFVITNVL